MNKPTNKYWCYKCNDWRNFFEWYGYYYCMICEEEITQEQKEKMNNGK